jgi:beta-catenin-like protein 1
MENLFDALCSALTEPPIKKQFLEAEGPDLMILMMK